MPRYFLAVLFVLACAQVSCGDDGGTAGSGDGDTDADTDADTDSDTDADSDSDVDTDSATENPIPQLDEDHPGWGNPDCWSCHADDPPYHTDGLWPYQCAGCHTSNGAPPRPADHAADGCDSCHSLHATEGFPVPVSCDVCHPQ